MTEYVQGQEVEPTEGSSPFELRGHRGVIALIDTREQVSPFLVVFDDRRYQWYPESELRPVTEKVEEPKRRLCAHANDSYPMHWLEPGEKCPYGPVEENSDEDEDMRSEFDKGYDAGLLAASRHGVRAWGVYQSDGEWTGRAYGSQMAAAASQMYPHDVIVPGRFVPDSEDDRQDETWCNCQAVEGTPNYPGPWHEKGGEPHYPCAPQADETETVDVFVVINARNEIKNLSLGKERAREVAASYLQACVVPAKLTYKRPVQAPEVLETIAIKFLHEKYGFDTTHDDAVREFAAAVRQAGYRREGEDR